MGIHNESGILKIQLPPSEELITRMLNFVIDINDPDRAFMPFERDGKDEVILLVNNLYVHNLFFRTVVHDPHFTVRGGMSELELSSIANDTVRILEGLPKKITVKRLLMGSYMV
jgi:dihydroxyacetone kinase